MGWAKFDDRWATHPKLMDAGATPTEVLEACALDARAICWSAGQETDGFVPDAALVILSAGHRNAKGIADRLVKVHRWDRDEARKGFQIHDYLTYNESRADALQRRAAKQEAGRKGGIRSGQTRRKPEALASPVVQPPGDHNGSGLVELPTRPLTTPPPRPPHRSTNGAAPDVAEEDPEDRESPTTVEAILAAAARKLASQDLTAHLASGHVVRNRAAWLTAAAANRMDAVEEIKPLVRSGELATVRAVVMRLGGGDPDDLDGSKKAKAAWEASLGRMAAANGEGGS